MNRVVNAFRKAIAPPDRISPIDWAQKHVKVPHSARSPNMDFSQTPWLIDPYREILNNDNKEITICAPVGSGKTSLFESLVCYVVAEDSGGMMVSLQTDADASNWAESRLHPVLENCEPVKPLIPTGKNRHKKRKTEILFPHMPLFIGGANLANLQEKSLRWILADEVWIWKQGMVNEARRRTHDRWNSRCVFVSQGSSIGDDFHKCFESGEKHVYHWKCDCGKLNPWKWEQLKFEQKITQDGDTDWQGTFETVHLECPHCAKTYSDNPQTRRKLSTNSLYIVDTASNPLPRHKSYTYTALCVWWLPWCELVKEWILANESKRRGDLNPLRQFLQKRLAEFWTEEKILDQVPIDSHGYTKDEYADGKLVDGEIKRLMTIDCQDHLEDFWFIVRAYTDTRSRLIDEGRVLSFDEILTKQQQFKVPSPCVFIDCAYETDRVLEQCAKNRWIGINGSAKDSYIHTDKKTGNAIQKLYSQPYRRDTPSGTAFWYGYAGDGIKDMLANYRANRTEFTWELPDDYSRAYKSQINSEVKKEHFNKKNGKTELGWVQIKKDNHFWDCETEQVAGALIHRLLN